MSYLTRHLSQTETPQNQAIPGSDQVKNSAGGYAWKVSRWSLLDRFLILGTEGGSYYVSEKDLTIEAGDAMLACLADDPKRFVERVVEISEAGRAPKNEPAIFALAVALGNRGASALAAAVVSRVCRTGTHLFTLCEYLKHTRGWGRRLRGAVGRWYQPGVKTADQLALQLVKYRQRGGWTHRDVLRKCHAKAHEEQRNAMLAWAVGKGRPDCHPLIAAFEQAQRCEDVRDAVRLLGEQPDLPWEAFPDAILSEGELWRALLPTLGQTALLRNLGRMTANGALKPFSREAWAASAQIDDSERIRRSRIHPIQVLAALMTYGQGHGARGSLTWAPVSSITDALERAFDHSFGNVEPSGKRTMLALDVSGSMDGGEIAGVPGLTPRMGACAMALVTARSEPKYQIMAFSNGFMPLDVTARDSMRSAIEKTDRLPFQGTDCALPMLWAMEYKAEVDLFVVYTDSETWFGSIHPALALSQYRRKSGINARLVMVGMVANQFSIANPHDPGMLDVVGFDTATPSVIAQFATMG